MEVRREDQQTYLTWCKAVPAILIERVPHQVSDLHGMATIMHGEGFELPCGGSSKDRIEDLLHQPLQPVAQGAASLLDLRAGN